MPVTTAGASGKMVAPMPVIVAGCAGPATGFDEYMAALSNSDCGMAGSAFGVSGYLARLAR